MALEDLLAEARRMARPCVHLRPHGEPSSLAALWRGPGQVPAPEGDSEHWLSIDCRFLPPGVGPASGVASVYTERGDRFGAVAHDPAARLRPVAGGRPLYAHPASSLPPLEAVFRYGSPAVRDWLAGIGWDPDGWAGDSPAGEVAEAYAEAERANLPLDGETVFAVLGGWHVPWPDGDWLDLVDCPLLVLTLAESEPWVEAFNVGGHFQVFQRVS